MFPRMLAGCILVGGVVLTGCGTSGPSVGATTTQTPTSHSASTYLPSHSAAGSLILAAPDFAPNFGDPLWIGWPGDAARLHILAQDVSQAPRLGIVRTLPGLQHTFWPLVQLGYGKARVVPLALDAKNTVAIGLSKGRWQLLKSSRLARILRDPRSYFSDTPTAHVTPQSHGRVAVYAGNLPGIRALLYATPPNGSQGKETVPPGSVLLATIPVVNGQMHWLGPIRLRSKDTAKRGWSLTLIIRPFPHFPMVSGESLGLGWPKGLTP